MNESMGGLFRTGYNKSWNILFLETCEIFQILCGLIACSILLIGVSLWCHWVYSRYITRDISNSRQWKQVRNYCLILVPGSLEAVFSWWFSTYETLPVI